MTLRDTLRDTLPHLAAAAEAHGHACVENGKDAEACRMFTIQERADALFVALVGDAATEALVERLMEGANV